MKRQKLIFGFYQLELVKRSEIHGLQLNDEPSGRSKKPLTN